MAEDPKSDQPENEGMAAKVPDPAVGLTKAVADEGNADVLAYNGPISMEGFFAVVEACRKRRNKRDSVILFLATFGGDANAAYRIARRLQRDYKKLCVLVTDFCKSAGTLLCLGAHELVLSPNGELGPLDVQMLKPNEIHQFGSGLDPMQALDYLETRALNMFRGYVMDIHVGGRVTTKLAGELARHLVAGLYGRLYAQLDPVRLGEVYRTMLIASDYGERLATKGGNVKPGAVADLVGRYPAHDFVIDIDEARSLFKRVLEPTEKQIALSDVLADRCPDIRHLVVGWADEIGDDGQDYEDGEEEDDADSKDAEAIVAASKRTGKRSSGASPLTRSSPGGDQQAGEGEPSHRGTDQGAGCVQDPGATDRPTVASPISAPSAGQPAG